MAPRAARLWIAALLVCLLAPSLAAADDQGSVGATVKLDQSALTASMYHVTADLRVPFTGTVHITTDRGHRVALTLTVVGGSWVSDIAPSPFPPSQTTTDVRVTGWVEVPRQVAEGVYSLALRARDNDTIFPIDTQAPFTVSVFRGPLAIFPAAEGKTLLPGGAARWNLTLRNLGSFDFDFDEAFTVPTGFTYSVVNPGIQILNAGDEAYVLVTVRAGATVIAGDYTWSVAVSSSSNPEVSTSTTIPYSVDRIVATPPTGTPDFLGQYWVAISIGMFAVGIVAYFSLTEVGYLALSFSVLVPLFTRIRHEKVLDNFTRGQIFGYIQANPGAHYSAIQQVLDIENGVLAYHLRVLLREEFVVARNEGVFKRFYPRDYKIPKGRTLLTRLQVDILEAVEKSPGISQRDVAYALGESKQVISYNVGVLREAGILSGERRGREVLLRAVGPTSGKRDPEDVAGATAPSDLTSL
jgi:predicted transcriptional regulator